MNYHLLLALVISFQGFGQSFRPDLQDRSRWELSGRAIENMQEPGKKGVKFDERDGPGFLILKNYDFATGTLEFDVRGKNVVQQSFVGVVFHLQTTSTYEAVYFRPFNFSNPDTARRSRAVQYIAMPGFYWDKLRADFPRRYENKVNPVPDPDDWFHVTVVIEADRVRVFVNNSPLPSLDVQRLTRTERGKLGLWVDNTSGGSFANLQISPR